MGVKIYFDQHEVFKRVCQQRGEDEAFIAVAAMSQGVVIELNASLSMVAARLSHELKLPVADSIILATAQANAATLWTQDADLEGKEGVKYQSKLLGKR